MAVFKPHPRCVQMSGDPIGKSPLRAPLESSGMKMLGLVMTFNAVANGFVHQNDPLMGVAAVAVGIPSLIVMDALTRIIEQGMLIRCFKQRASKYIDRAPDKKTPPPQSSDLASARELVKEVGLTLSILPGLGIAFAALKGQSYVLLMMQEFWQAITEPSHAWGVGSLALVTRVPQIGYRFYKVAKGDYVVVDELPPAKTPQQVRTAKTGLSPAPHVVL